MVLSHLVKLILASAFSSLCFTALAQELKNENELSEITSSYIPAKVKKRKDPIFPIAAAREGRDGWVKLSFVISETGSVKHAVVLDSSGHKDLEKSAKKAVKLWKYEPAQENGKPIEQCDNSVRLDYMLQGSLTATKRFANQYKKISQHLQNKEYEKVEPLLKKLEQGKLKNFYEISYFNLLSADYYQAVGNDDLAYKHLKRVTSLPSDSLSTETYLGALHDLYLTQLNTMRLAGAKDTYQQFLTLDEDKYYVDAFAEQDKIVTEFIKNDKLVKVTGAIESSRPWMHQLARKDFTLANVKGDVEKLDIRCEKKYESFDFEFDATWEIPDSWGQCTLFVYGDKKTEFELIEYPLNSES